MGRFDALEVLGTVSLLGGRPRRGRAARERAARDRRADRARRPPERRAARAQRHLQRAARDRAGPTSRSRVAIELAGTSGSPTTRGWILRASGRQAALEGRLDDAEAALDAGARDLRRERSGADARANAELARDRRSGSKRDLHGAEETLREAIRILKPIEDRGTLVESQRLLAQVLLDQGRLDEAERLRARGARDRRRGRRRRRARRPGSRSGSCGPRRGGTTRRSGCCARPTRSCGRPGSGGIRSRRSRRSPRSSAPADREDEARRGRGGARAHLARRAPRRRAADLRRPLRLRRGRGSP